MTRQTINLNLIPSGVKPVIHVSQYDEGQTWIFNVMEGTQYFEIPENSFVTMQGSKIDGTTFVYSCTYEGHTVTATEQQQQTVIAGDVPAEIRITKDGSIIGSLNFVIRVEESPVNDDTIISETDMPLIEQIIEFINEVPVIVAGMEELKADAEAWAVGTRDGEPVPSTDPAYENNAKYYAEHFVGYITDAQWAQIEQILD